MLGDLLDFAGGLIGQRQQDKQFSQGLKFEKQKFAASQKQFDAQMDQSVQRRVKDATAAGIHPLFALGASVGASPTLSTGSAPAPTGSAVGDALSRIGERMALAGIRKTEAEAEKNEAEAELAKSRIATATQAANARGQDAAALAVQLPPVSDQVSYYTPEVPQRGSDGYQKTGAVQSKGRLPDGRNLRGFNENIPGNEELNMVWTPIQLARYFVTDLMRELDKRTPAAIRDYWTLGGGILGPKPRTSPRTYRKASGKPNRRKKTRRMNYGS